MTIALTIRDEDIATQSVSEWSLDVLTEKITVRELIRGRIYQEVGDFNRDRPNTFKGLIQPTPIEHRLNKKPEHKARTIDWKKQFEKAIQAYQDNQFLILVDDHQTDSLDETIVLKTTTCVSFVRLTPLIGG